MELAGDLRGATFCHSTWWSFVSFYLVALKILGNWLEDSGWTNALVEAKIANPGVANSFIKASNVKRARRAHQVTASALYALLNKAYVESEHEMALEDASSFNKWCQERMESSPHFQFWHITLQLELLYLVFVRSFRESDFELYLDAVQKLAAWCFALDHTNYARWLPVHLQDMLSLEEELPYVYHQFLNHGFVVQKTSRRFSSIAVDQAHEQNNALVKGDGGAVGLLENPAALRRWMISGPEIARIIAEFEAGTAIITDEKIDPAKHHEETEGVQISFAKDVKALVCVMEEMGNPFLEQSGDLLVLDTRTIADASVIATVRQIEAAGKLQLNTYFEECLTAEQRSMYEPIKKNNFKLFSSSPPKIPSKDKQQIAILKNDCALFSRLYIACQTRDGDLDGFFEHEN